MALPIPKTELVIERTVQLPEELAAALHDFCAASGEGLADVVADAIMLHLDAANADFEAHGDAL
jgi:hypothetical protein